MIQLFTNSRYKINKKFILSELSKQTSLMAMIGDENINIIFIGKRKMLEIANKYKSENEALPVLTFPYLKNSDDLKDVPEEKVIGEIFICYPQAVLLAAERNKVVDKMMLELIVHGINNIFK
jgi:rRNA maturation RNase YbeY